MILACPPVVGMASEERNALAMSECSDNNLTYEWTSYTDTSANTSSSVVLPVEPLVPKDRKLKKKKKRKRKKARAKQNNADSYTSSYSEAKAGGAGNGPTTKFERERDILRANNSFKAHELRKILSSEQQHDPSIKSPTRASLTTLQKEQKEVRWKMSDALSDFSAQRMEAGSAISSIRHVSLVKHEMNSFAFPDAFCCAQRAAKVRNKRMDRISAMRAKEGKGSGSDGRACLWRSPVLHCREPWRETLDCCEAIHWNRVRSARPHCGDFFRLGLH